MGPSVDCNHYCARRTISKEAAGFDRTPYYFHVDLVVAAAAVIITIGEKEN